MVYRKIGKSEAMSLKRKNNIWLFLVLLGMFVATAVVVCCVLCVDNFSEGDDQSKVEDSEAEVLVTQDLESLNPDVKSEFQKIDFQPVVEEWAESIGGDKGVFIYDLDRDETVASYNSTEKYSTASLYKLFVVYEGYRRLESGEWQADAPAGSTGYTIKECLDLAIRQSHSPCAETMWREIGHEELQKIVEEEFGVSDTSVGNLVSTPEDIATMLKIYYYHSDIENADLVAQMKDSFLTQPITEYNWRQGLPSGFSRANVYNKVGWDYNPNGGYWNIYDDAAIVEFPEDKRNFIVVVMTNHVSYQQVRTLGTMIENQYVLKN